MQAVAGIAFVLLVVCAWLVGVRLLLLARQTRALPEECLGAMILFLLGVGYPLAIGAQAEAMLGLFLSKVFQGLSNLFIDVGFALALVFTWKVFRPRSRWASALTLLGIAGLILHWSVVTLIVAELESMSGAVEATRWWAQLSLATGGLAYAWTAVESFRYRALLERRMSIGLADPVVTNRFLLWGIMGSITALGSLANSYFLITEIDVLTHPVAQSVTSLAGVSQAALLYLTFVPPAAYTRWLVGRAAEPIG